MGFFSKLWKGIKKVVKKIGRGIKKVVGKVGKFVGKLGIVGQIGMFFLMPHVAGFMMKGLSAASSGLLNFANATSGLGGALAKGLGTVLKTAHSFAGTVGNVFGTITEGVSNFAKTALNKIPGITIDGAATNFFGKIETPILMHITGHTKESTFLKYIGKTQSRDAYADAFMEKARFIL